jgi:cytoskeletal protein RodZ
MQTKNHVVLGAIAGLALALGGSGCSWWQNMVQGQRNALSSSTQTMTTTTTNKMTTASSDASSTATSAVPAVPAAPAVPAVPTGANGAYAVPPVPPSVDMNAAKSDACKNAKTGPCKTWIDQGNSGNFAAAYCGIACVMNLCGETQQAQAYATQAKAAGTDCGLGGN